MFTAELLEYDPANFNTYPSVCNDPEEVKARFGFRGGETLLFDRKGNYLGQVIKRTNLAVELTGRSKRC